ncbi:MAG: hypothetical protein IGS38_06470 [Synechococcales cyanobacterium M58_A2018_015]|nr:hypothetical protein [Synechococcales cyanobacterium M58_A2018_015]
MALNPNVMRAVEALDYRVTIGDVASQAGLDVRLAERDLLALASEAGGHIQVAESGEIAYLFPRNFRSILRNKYWRLRWQERLQKLWGFVFYLIRISFGIFLIVSIVLIVLAIAAILIALSASRGDDDRGGDFGEGGMVFVPRFWFSPDWFLIFTPDYYSSSRRRGRKARVPADRPMNFLEAIFSFLFGDGDPNADLDERRWQTIGTVIRNNGGAVVAEQIAPYLDDLGSSAGQDDEDYMLPVLSRFNGRPEVSPDGQIVYHFPELQITAAQTKPRPVAAYLKELPWQFSKASSGQIMLAIGLGAINIIGALMLGALLGDGSIAYELGGLVAFVNSIYWLLLGYGSGFLGIPLIRYFWLKGRNRKIESRNQQRQSRAVRLNRADAALQQKLSFARQFAAETVVDENDLAYTTESDLTEQEYRQSDKIDAEWQRRLEQSGS